MSGETSAAAVLVSSPSPAASPWSGTITLCVWEYQGEAPDRGGSSLGAPGAAFSPPSFSTSVGSGIPWL